MSMFSGGILIGRRNKKETEDKAAVLVFWVILLDFSNMTMCTE